MTARADAAVIALRSLAAHGFRLRPGRRTRMPVPPHLADSVWALALRDWLTHDPQGPARWRRITASHDGVSQADYEYVVRSDVERAHQRNTVAYEQTENDRWEHQAFELSTSRRTREPLGCRLVWVYHGTSDVFLSQILESGLHVRPPKRTWHNTTSGYVYVTASSSDADDYARKAAYQHGGDRIILRLIVPSTWLTADRDDGDLRCGKLQWRSPHDLPPSMVFEVGGGRVRPLLDPERDVWARGYGQPRS